VGRGRGPDRDWRRIEPGGKEHRDYVWQVPMCDRPARTMAVFGKPPEPKASRPIFPQDKNQDPRHPSRWTSGFLNRTYAAYNRSYFHDLEGAAPIETGPPPLPASAYSNPMRPSSAPATRRTPREFLPRSERSAGGSAGRSSARPSSRVPGYAGFVPRTGPEESLQPPVPYRGRH
jgi:hypothetical protein